MVNSINKGKGGEREIVNLLKEKGVYAKRIGMMETNHEDKGDIEFGFVEKVEVGQVKIGSHVPKKLYDFLAHEEVAFVRRDRERWLVVCELDYFLEKYLN